MRVHAALPKAISQGTPEMFEQRECKLQEGTCAATQAHWQEQEKEREIITCAKTVELPRSVSLSWEQSPSTQQLVRL